LYIVHPTPLPAPADDRLCVNFPCAIWANLAKFRARPSRRNSVICDAKPLDPARPTGKSRGFIA
ncbi:hypothetical protein, partial [Sphingobium xenophagum]|uniref:hypothetical protein n=1 Tax=Sphingobium xenophagum TaxID=121428 RepID=UPI0036D30BC9